MPGSLRNSASAMPVAATCAFHLQALGYSLERLLEAGLMGPQGLDTFCHRVIFPCRQQHPIVNL